MRRHCLMSLFFSSFILVMCFTGVAFCSTGESGSSITVLPDSSVFVQIINFLLLIFILNIVLYKPIRSIITKRKKKIAEFEQDVESALSDTKKEEKAFAYGIKEARTSGLKEKELLIAEAVQEERKIVAEINKTAQADLAEIKNKIAKNTEAVKGSLIQEVNDFANIIGKKILGRAIR
mmetsp:Transcript_21554/g.10029  ORF Transcript_21554/g.10029 Transcript_21554/m.10029 type:complete len:178 (-) Transcript_21554:2024-2557(-)